MESYNNLVCEAPQVKFTFVDIDYHLVKSIYGII